MSLNKQSEVSSFRYGRAADQGGAGERGSKGGKVEEKKAGACKLDLMKMVLLVLMLEMRMMLRRRRSCQKMDKKMNIT